MDLRSTSVLYISPSFRHTHAARRNCEAIVARFDPRRLHLEICDVSRHPERAEEDAVYFTPMLVDDYPGARYLRSRVLSEAGYEVLEASGREKALRIAAEARPALASGADAYLTEPIDEVTLLREVVNVIEARSVAE